MSRRRSGESVAARACPKAPKFGGSAGQVVRNLARSLRDHYSPPDSIGWSLQDMRNRAYRSIPRNISGFMAVEHLS
jgi:hypothetical protein